MQKDQKEKATVKEREAAERERIRQAIKDDRQMRKFAHETRVQMPNPSPRSRSSRDGDGLRPPSHSPAPRRLHVRGEDEDQLHEDLSDTQNDSD